MSKRPIWSTPLPRPIVIPKVMTLKTLADVRKLIDHIPKERRQLSTWMHVDKTLQACARGDAGIAMPLLYFLPTASTIFTIIRPAPAGGAGGVVGTFLREVAPAL